jgi:signal transduction histidine kinase
VWNLVENAIHYDVAHGEVHVRVATRAGQATIEVANTGPEVAAEDIERLMQPFQRQTSDGRPSGKGSGRTASGNRLTVRCTGQLRPR